MSDQTAVSRRLRSSGDAERGDTLIEILVALVIIGLTASAFLGGFVESIAASGQHRSHVTLDALLKSFAEATKFDIQYRPVTAMFTDCVRTRPPSGPPSTPLTTYTILGTPSPTTGPAGTVVTVFGTGYSPASPLTLTLNSINIPAGNVLFGGTSDANGDVALTFQVPAPSVVPNGSYTITVSDAAGYSATSTDNFAVTSGPLLLTTAPLQSYRVAITSIEWWNSGALSFDPSTGVSPPPCQAGDHSGIQRLTITATAPDSTKDTLAILVTNPGTAPPQFTPVLSQPVFTIGTNGSFTVTTTGYPTPALTDADFAGPPACTASALPSGVTFTDNGDGTATVKGTPGPTTSGTYNICINAINSASTTTTGTTTTTTPATQAFLLTVQQPQLLFTTQPGGGPDGASWGTQPIVTIEDAQGNPVTSGTYSSAPVTLVIATSPGTGAVLTCANNPLPASSGVAAFAGCKIDGPVGNYILTATATGVTNATSATFTISTGAASQLVFSTQPGNGVNGALLSTQPQVTVEDSGGNPITTGAGSTAPITLVINTQPGSGATLTCANNTVPAAGGTATFAGCRIVGTVGTYKLGAAAAGGISGTSSTFTIATGPAAQLLFTAQPGGGFDGVAWSSQPTVAITDSGGNTVTTAPNTTITLGILNNPSGGTLTCATNQVTTASGVASFNGCRIDRPGNGYTLMATGGGYTQANSSTFAITVGPASQFLISPPTASPNAGSPVTVTLTAADAFGYTVTAYSGTHTIAWSGSNTSPAGSAPSYPNSSVTFANGVSTTPLTVTLFSAGANTLKASEAALMGSATITVSPLSGTHLAWTAVSNTHGALTGLCYFSCTYTSVGSAGSVFKAKISLTDTYGNLVINAASPFNVVVSLSAGTFTASSTVTIPTGGAQSNTGGDGSVPGEITYMTETNGWGTDTLSMTNTGAITTNATASFSKN